MVARDAQRLGAIRRRKHRVSLPAEQPGGKRTYRGVIFNDENRLAPAWQFRPLFDRHAQRNGIFINHLRQINAERGAFTWFALHAHPPAVLLDDLITDRQPQSRAAACGLRGKERLEDLRLRLRLHANTSIADGEENVATTACFSS